MTGPRRETNRGCAASAGSNAIPGIENPRRSSSSAPRECIGLLHCAEGTSAADQPGREETLPALGVVESGCRIPGAANSALGARAATPSAPYAPIDLWRSRYPDKALVGAEREAREREARGKQLRYGVSLKRRHARAHGRLLAEG